MATEQDLEVVEDNDSVVVVTCKVDGAAIDLTGAQIDFYLKPDKATDEIAPTVVHYSSEGGEITLRTQSGATLGQAEIRFSRTDIPEPGKKRYRLDVTQAERRLTFAYGKVVILDV
jgi:hypothetical protein